MTSISISPNRNGRQLLPSARSGAGEVLWGEAPRKQPIVPLIALALITLLVAAPAAMSGQGQSSDPMVLMHQTAASLYDVTGEMAHANVYLNQIDLNTRSLRMLSTNMGLIQGSAGGLAEKTSRLNISLAGVGSSVHDSGTALSSVDKKLVGTAGTMGPLKTSVGSSLTSTQKIVTEFNSIDGSIGKMSTGLNTVVGLMSASIPQTTQFATNPTRLSMAGGDGHKFGVPNLVPGNKVMSAVLPMIMTMQNGGMMAARKDSATTSNPLVGALLKQALPDGVNTALGIKPYDGFYGLPGPDWFVNHQVNGF